MIDGNPIILLSPPCSPRLSAYSTSPTENGWQSTAEHTPPHSDSDMTMLQAEHTAYSFDIKRPIMRTHKSSPYLLQSKSQLNNDPTSPPRIDTIESDDLPVAIFGGSAPTSPVSRLSPSSAHDDANEERMEDDGDELIDDGKEDLAEGESNEEERPLTAAEIRAAKRKMKRFRLTHNQTRFLMSEFARQAHPDAAHRERLSREIPGLSPRQVQVWFQNRRAKLKRLTSDDRERMMRSRALPDDFDMAQALHAPFSNTHNVGTPLASPTPYTPGFPDNNIMRSLSIDTFRRGPGESHMSSTGISPAFGGFAFTPPQSASSSMPNQDASSFGFTSAALETSPKSAISFSMPASTSPAYATNHSMPRLGLHTERLARVARTDSVNSPLRTSISYSNDDLNTSNDPSSHGDASRSFSSSMMAYGIGYSYSSIPGFQATSSTRMRSFSNGVPRRIELSTNYPPGRSTSTPQTAQFPSYTSTSLATPHNYAMPQMSAPHHLTSFSSPYMRNDSAHSDHYSGVGSVLREVMEGSLQGDEQY